jgi:probable phosphoglycerate mutase
MGNTSSTMPRSASNAGLMASRRSIATYRWSNVPVEAIEAGEKQAQTVFSKYLRRTRGDDKSEIIVSHGNLIRYLATRALNGSAEGWFRMETFNCGITEIVIDSDGRLSLVACNDVSHLPADLVTAGIPKRVT